MINFFKHFSLLAGAVIVFAGSLHGQEEKPVEKTKELEPTKLMQGEARWLAQALQRAHYSKVSVEKVDPKEFLETYMKSLDRQRLYFLQADHDRYLKTFLPTIPTYLKQGNLFPGFRIYNDYREKSLVRLKWVMKRLQGEFSFDSDAIFIADREKLPWP